MQTKWQAKTNNQRERLYRRMKDVFPEEMFDVVEAAIEVLQAAEVEVVIPVPVATKSKAAA
jgi:hypothetical protein